MRACAALSVCKNDRWEAPTTLRRNELHTLQINFKAIRVVRMQKHNMTILIQLLCFLVTETVATSARGKAIIGEQF